MREPYLWRRANMSSLCKQQRLRNYRSGWSNQRNTFARLRACGDASSGGWWHWASTGDSWNRDQDFSSFKTPQDGVRPETYEGRGDLAEYLSHFNDCAELGGWTERERAEEIVITRLWIGHTKATKSHIIINSQVINPSWIFKISAGIGRGPETWWLESLQT